MKNALSILFLSLCFTFSVFAQETDLSSILEKYYEAIGGPEDWQDVQSLKISGTVEQAGMQMPITMYQARPNKMRWDVSITGMSMVQAFSGEHGWTINPMTGSMNPQKMTEEESKAMDNTYLEDRLVNYKEKNIKLEYLGTEDLDDTPTYKIKLTEEDEEEVIYYLDAEYFVPIMVANQAKEGPTAGMITKTYMSNYKQVGGLMLPFAMESKVNDQMLFKISIDAYEVNPDIKDTYFDMPTE